MNLLMRLKMIGIRGMRYIKKLYRKCVLQERDITIISNNCIGADIYHSLDMKFNSPTVDLQILPSDYVKFLQNLNYYINCDVEPCCEFTACQIEAIIKTYGREPNVLDFPFAKCGDVLICFQHYKSFKDGKEAWDRRKMRIKNKMGIIFCERERFYEEIKQFDKLDLGNAKKIIFALDFEPADLSSRVINVKTPVIGG